MTSFIAILVLLCFTIPSSESWTFNIKNCKPSKIAAAICITAGVTLGGNGIPAHANPIEAATRAMMEKKEKTVVERELNDMPESAKKRRGLKVCKDSPKEGGYRSTAACNEAVLSGDYSILMGGGPKAAAASASLGSSSSSPSSSSSSLSSSSVSSSSSSSSSVASSESPPTPSGPKINLADLSPASLKRRSMAACKKPDVRKFAKLGSESKCTESVMKGDYAKVLSALEAGF